MASARTTRPSSITADLRFTTARALAALTCAAVVAVAAPAHAVRRDPARAEQMFALGKQAMDRGELEEAAKAFAASQEADPSVGALLNLALVHEKMGKTATAWGEYKAAASLAAQTGQADRATGAKQRAEKLEPTLSKLTVDVPDKQSNLVVTVDAQELPAVSYGVALPVDPGGHEVEASAPGFETWSTRVDVAGDAASAKVAVPKLVKGGGHRRGQLIAGGVVGGVGVIGLVAGIVQGVRALGIRDYLKDPSHCTQNAEGKFDCDTVGPNGAETAQKLDSFKPTANAATALLIVGGVLTVTGAVVMLTAPKAPSEGPTTGATWWLAPNGGPGGASMTLGATF